MKYMTHRSPVSIMVSISAYHTKRPGFESQLSHRCLSLIGIMMGAHLGAPLQMTIRFEDMFIA